jgi:glutathione S-transferase
MTDTLFLWGNFTCPYVQRVRIALTEKRVQYEDKLVEKVADSTEFKELFTSCHPYSNPAVPVIQHRGLVLPESDIIIAYLLEEFPDEAGGRYPPLLPQSAGDRAIQRLFVPLFMAKLLPCVRMLFTAGTHTALSAAIDTLDAGCASLEAFLKCHCPAPGDGGRTGDFVAGELFYFAECVTAPHLQRLRILSSDSIRPQITAALLNKLPAGATVPAGADSLLYFLENKYPRLHCWAVAVLARESVVNSFPTDVITAVIANVTVPWVGE